VSGSGVPPSLRHHQRLDPLPHIPGSKCGRSLLLRINILFAILVSWNLFALIARVVDMA
jgi:hypothetical protein